jgi:hypothetical protein
MSEVIGGNQLNLNSKVMLCRQNNVTTASASIVSYAEYFIDCCTVSRISVCV